ncbi:hypothetical protein Vi05172_g8007 [Venturia inaequalis]|nr:hypothetical protein Vi05172_g8007 [Venturia inaequalis]
MKFLSNPTVLLNLILLQSVTAQICGPNPPDCGYNQCQDVGYPNAGSICLSKVRLLTSCLEGVY